jgi:hypothetical protein
MRAPAGAAPPGARRPGATAGALRFAGSVPSSTASASRPRPRRAQAVDGAGEGELRALEPVDEVAAAELPGLLHGAEHRVHRAEAARDVLGREHVARHHAVAVEQHEGARVRAARRVGRLRGELRHEGPAARRERRHAAARAPALAAQREGAERREGVVRDEPAPDEPASAPCTSRSPAAAPRRAPEERGAAAPS